MHRLDERAESRVVLRGDIVIEDDPELLHETTLGGSASTTCREVDRLRLTQTHQEARPAQATEARSEFRDQLLQEIQRLLVAREIPATFVRCAAPTGCAAFNMKFNATTIHRLIKWTNLKTFGEITHEDTLAALQQHLEATNIIFLDEVSMIGRKMMARIDSRFQQGKAV